MRLRFLIIPALLLIGCATHFHRDEPDAVVLYLKAPKAQVVQIAASYNGYALQNAQHLNSAKWSVRLPKGVEFSYFYLIDGDVFIPGCELKEQDDFGQANCIFSPIP